MIHVVGVITVLLSYFDTLAVVRIGLGHLYVFVLCGWSISKRLIPNLHLLERLVLASLISLFLTYPASVVVTFIEGQSGQAIFSQHLPTSMSVLFVISTLLSWGFKKIFPKTLLNNNKVVDRVEISKTLVFAVVLFTMFGWIRSDYPDIYNDEYDLGYQAYNLVDGILAGRKAYVVSYSGHPPLAMSVKHYSLNLLEAKGLDYLKDWQFRFSEVLLGQLVIVTAYLLAYQLTHNRQTANFTCLILATNSYFIWLARILHREMLLTFTLTAFVYFLVKTKKNPKYWWISGFCLGLSLLVKEAALLIVPLLWFINSKKTIVKIIFLALVMFTPIIVYNVVAYILTGYADVFFSNLFGTYRPGGTPRDPLDVQQNLLSLGSYLADLYSQPVLAFLFLATVVTFINRRLLLLHGWIVVIVVFFMLTALRGYYFVYITVPLAILLADILSNKNSFILKIILILVLAMSVRYTLHSHILRNDLVSTSSVQVDSNVIIPSTPLQQRSQVVEGWARNLGYKQVVEKLTVLQRERPGCFEFSNHLNDLAVRRYFWIRDGIKTHYLGNYLSRFPECNASHGVKYYITNQQENSYQIVDTIKDSDNNTKLYIYSI